MWLNALTNFTLRGDNKAIFESISQVLKSNSFNERHEERILLFTDVMASSIPSGS
jgi:hypothetical protein